MSNETVILYCDVCGEKIVEVYRDCAEAWRTSSGEFLCEMCIPKRIKPITNDPFLVSIERAQG